MKRFLLTMRLFLMGKVMELDLLSSEHGWQENEFWWCLRTRVGLFLLFEVG